jgi:hypothetical protein
MKSRRRVNSDVMRLHDSMIVDKPKLVSAVGAFLGSIILLAGVYVFLESRLVSNRRELFVRPDSRGGTRVRTGWERLCACVRGHGSGA